MRDLFLVQARLLRKDVISKRSSGTLSQRESHNFRRAAHCKQNRRSYIVEDLESTSNTKYQLSVSDQNPTESNLWIGCS